MGYGNYCYPVSNTAALCLAGEKGSVAYEASYSRALLNWTAQTVVPHR